MSLTAEIKLEEEFASTMQQLVAEAQTTIAPVPAESTGTDHAASDRLSEEVATLSERIGGLETRISQEIEKLTAALPSSNDNVATQLQRVDDHLAKLRSAESVNQRLFDSLHQELRSYRDNFLRESLQKPFIRDLVMMFDDLTSLSAQMKSETSEVETKQDQIAQWNANLQNSLHALLEIMHRMEVTEIEPQETVDRAVHKVVRYEAAESAEEDGRILSRIKAGFVWRGQVLRPEEVIAKRFG
ncbi:MAG: nucleotide exchange factor GrpE [Chthoniobacterales bacterium]|nr:nucleotide exchange factor GrpE [Chthoniobacterales bacterium]